MKDASQVRTWIGLAVIFLVIALALPMGPLFNFEVSTGVWIGLGVVFYFGVLRGGFGCCRRKTGDCAPDTA
jgi:hypothetical protein